MRNSKAVALRALLILFIVGSPMLVSAGGGLKIMTNAGEKTAIISLAEIQSDFGTFTIEDISENLVYYSTYVRNTSEFIKLFDYSSLKDGDYKIIVKLGSSTIKKTISIVDSKLVVQVPRVSEKPVFLLKDEKLFVQFRNDMKNETRVAISSINGVFFEDLSSEKRLAKRYDVSGLPSGIYEVFISNENDSFSYEFVLDY